MNVLIIDEREDIIQALHDQVEELGITVFSTSSLDAGLEICRKGKENDIEIILMRDLVSGVPSYHSLQVFKSTELLPEVLIYTEAGNPEDVEVALEGGAWDYIVIQDPRKSLMDALRRVLRYRKNKDLNLEENLHKVARHQEDFGIIGSSPSIQNCVDLMSRIAQSDASVLITGETGTGKEVFASAIHNISERNSKSMTVVDCAALPTTLVESILFGHIKGSFTGADKRQTGLVKQADGGSLFLDEVGEMPLEIQKKFLRVLQEGTYLPVGSRTPESSDFRLIAATNKDLEQMVEEGSFREDLFYRLKTFQLELPPLRSRRIDIAELAYYFRNHFCSRKKLKKKKLSTDYLVSLNSYEWPGNVRELYQAVEYSMIDAQDSTVLESAHLPLNIRLAVTKKKLATYNNHEDSRYEVPAYKKISSMPTLKEDRERAINDQEKRYLETLLHLSGGDMKLCCETAGLSRSRLYDLLKKYSLSKKTSS